MHANFACVDSHAIFSCMTRPLTEGQVLQVELQYITVNTIVSAYNYDFLQSYHCPVRISVLLLKYWKIDSRDEEKIF